MLESKYQESDHEIQLAQNDEIRENTRLTRYALLAAILLGLTDVIVEILQLLK